MRISVLRRCGASLSILLRAVVRARGRPLERSYKINVSKSLLVKTVDTTSVRVVRSLRGKTAIASDGGDFSAGSGRCCDGSRFAGLSPF